MTELEVIQDTLAAHPIWRGSSGTWWCEGHPDWLDLGSNDNDANAHVAAEVVLALRTWRATHGYKLRRRCSCHGMGYRSGGTYEYESPCSLCDGSGWLPADGAEVTR